MKTPMEELIDEFDKMLLNTKNVYDRHVIGQCLRKAADKLEKEKQMISDVIDWYSKLNPSDKVSVWSKGGDTKGLFNLDSEQLAKKYYTQTFTETKE